MSNWYTNIKLAHRGLHNAKLPENSLGAFSNAVKHNVAIELDVRLLKDGTVVVFHDSNINRMCGVDKELNSITLQELENYPLNGTKYLIPTLQEVLDEVDGKTPIMIELKPISKKDKLEEKVYNVIKDYQGELAIKSFNPFSVLWFKKHAPNITRGMLSCYYNDTKLPKLYKLILKKLLLFPFIKPQFISYNIEDMPNKYVSNKKVPILVWTIRSPEQEAEALKIADNVIFENYIPSQSNTGV